MTQKPKISKTQKTQLSLFFTKLQKKRKWKYLDFVSQLFKKLGFRSVEYTKMTVWNSGLWKINIHVAKKWPEPIIEQSFKSNIRFRSVFMYDFITEYQRFTPMNEIFQFILIVECCTFRGCPWPIWSWSFVAVTKCRLDCMLQGRNH